MNKQKGVGHRKERLKRWDGGINRYVGIQWWVRCNSKMIFRHVVADSPKGGEIWLDHYFWAEIYILFMYGVGGVLEDGKKHRWETD